MHISLRPVWKEIFPKIVILAVVHKLWHVDKRIKEEIQKLPFL